MTENPGSRFYFEILAELGLTKHYGSLDATRQLLELCQVTRDQRVLEIGCGVGATSVYLAKSLGTRVIGSDLIEKMLPQAAARARRFQVEGLVDFIAADARQLPFPSDHFDGVILESVNVFFEDKVSALREYLRVIRPGGFIGLTEMTWLRPPAPELEAVFRDTAYAIALDEDSWKGTLAAAGLAEVAGQAHRIDVSRESRGRVERYGWGDLLKVVPRTLKLILKDQQTRRLFRDASGGLTRDVLDVVGYGVYAGRKPAGS